MKRLMAIVALSFVATSVWADDGRQFVYEVKITNLTKANQFTPILAAAHKRSISYFEVGEPALDGAGGGGRGEDEGCQEGDRHREQSSHRADPFGGRG